MKRKFLIPLAIIACLAAGVFGSLQAENVTHVRVMNGLDNWDIHYVYISPASSSSWGEDQLYSDQILRPGGTASWAVDAGMFDLKAVDEDGDEYIRRNVSVPSGFTLEWLVVMSDRQTN